MVQWLRRNGHKVERAEVVIEAKGEQNGLPSITLVDDGALVAGWPRDKFGNGSRRVPSKSAELD